SQRISQPQPISINLIISTSLHKPQDTYVNQLRNRRSLHCAAVLMAATLLAGFGHVPILREIASFLIVEDSLQPGAAIVALGGQTPFREIEAAELYRAGLAPNVVIVRVAPNDESTALQQLGIKKVPEWELSRQVLIQQGVPTSAILLLKDDAQNTLRNYKPLSEGFVPKKAR